MQTDTGLAGFAHCAVTASFCIMKKWFCTLCLQRTQVFWMYKGHMMQRRRHQSLTTVPYCGSFLLWPSYSTGADLNKDLLTLYISVYTNPSSKQWMSINFVWKIADLPHGYKRTGWEGACFIKSGAWCYLQLLATRTKWEKYLFNRPESFASAGMRFQKRGAFCLCVTGMSHILWFPGTAQNPVLGTCWAQHQ